MLDPQLLEGLEEAVEASPGNRALHLHLTALLLSGTPADQERALGHAHWALLHTADDIDFHTLAAQALDLLGDTDRAARHRRVADALNALSIPEGIDG